MNFRQQYARIREFYRDRFREKLKIGAVGFLVLIFVGFVLGQLNPGIAETIINMFAGLVQNLGITDQLDASAFAIILLNNLEATAATILYGILPFLYMPALSLGANAMLLGLFASFYLKHGLSLLTYLAGIVPHGIFELPALILACSLGLQFCNDVTDRLKKVEGAPAVLESFKDCSRVYVFLIVPLLLVAAGIETFVTPAIMGLVK